MLVYRYANICRLRPIHFFEWIEKLVALGSYLALVFLKHSEYFPYFIDTKDYMQIESSMMFFFKN